MQRVRRRATQRRRRRRGGALPSGGHLITGHLIEAWVFLAQAQFYPTVCDETGYCEGDGQPNKAYMEIALASHECKSNARRLDTQMGKKRNVRENGRM
uniref:Uncharacterized protein n=1 Tax=Oryza sativa subsp. japonica TaxID=39947 RepID=Q69UW7_ORYSJ|nr:hypothetical protein [Oryza sativa Japonica Group]BAD33084.1 hypothetical protein [Oryza sativa Japonica Group]